MSFVPNKINPWLRAPGLLKTLQGMMREDVLERLGELFTVCLTANEQVEAPLKRIPEANFNPRPARLAHILIKELKEQSPQVIGAAFLVCSTERQITNLPSNFVSQHAQAVRLALLALDPHNFRNDPASERLALALRIDTLRHIHMQNTSMQEKKKLLAEFEDEGYCKASFAENSRLETILRETLSKLLRLMENNESK